MLQLKQSFFRHSSKIPRIKVAATGNSQTLSRCKVEVGDTRVERRLMRSRRFRLLNVRRHNSLHIARRTPRRTRRAVRRTRRATRRTRRATRRTRRTPRRTRKTPRRTRRTPRRARKAARRAGITLISRRIIYGWILLRFLPAPICR